MWTKERIIALNKLICEASDQPHAIRDEGVLELAVKQYGAMASLVESATGEGFEIHPEVISEKHPFVEGNKRTAACIAICETLKNI